MPLTQEQVDRLADQLVGVYTLAEQRCLAIIARHLWSGIDAPEWATEKLLTVQLALADLRRALAGLPADTAAEVESALRAAFMDGAARASADLLKAGLADRIAAVRIPHALTALIAETTSSVTAQYATILRTCEDAYRAVIREATALQLTGAATRREMAQQALDEFAARGITGFVGRDGRRWETASYTEMAMRTAARRAQVDGHVQQLQAHGQHLIVVSDHAQECPRCSRWEGKVLSIDGVIPADTEVAVAGTLDQARAAGFQHNGCRHTVGAFLPGYTELPTATMDTAGYEDRERLRYLERQTRAWKRREEVAGDDIARAKARRKVRDYQAQIRDHVATTTAKRQPFRESTRAPR